MKVKLVALSQPESKTGSKNFVNVFKVVFAFKSSGLLPRQTVVESGVEARRLSEYLKARFYNKNISNLLRRPLSQNIESVPQS